MVDLLVAVAQLVRRFTADSRVAVRVCRTALLDGDIGVRGPLGGFRILDGICVPRCEFDTLSGCRVVRRIVSVVVPGDLDTVGGACRDGAVQSVNELLHTGRPGENALAGIGDGRAGNSSGRVEVVLQLNSGGSDCFGEQELDGGTFTGRGYRRTGVVDRRHLVFTHRKGVAVVDDGHCQGCRLLRG